MLNLLVLNPLIAGVRLSQHFVKYPQEFDKTYKVNTINNIKIIKGSILDQRAIELIKNNSYDLIFTNAVLEQLNNYLDATFDNIFSLDFKNFLFIEEWLEANYPIEKYNILLKNDYFRASTQYLNKYPCELIEFLIPPIQPSWLTYACAFGIKYDD